MADIKGVAKLFHFQNITRFPVLGPRYSSPTLLKLSGRIAQFSRLPRCIPSSFPLSYQKRQLLSGYHILCINIQMAGTQCGSYQTIVQGRRLNRHRAVAHRWVRNNYILIVAGTTRPGPGSHALPIQCAASCRRDAWGPVMILWGRWEGFTEKIKFQKCICYFISQLIISAYNNRPMLDTII